MKKLYKSLVACLLIALAVALPGCVQLEGNPALYLALDKTETRSRMHALDISSVELSCSPIEKKVVGQFQFLYLDGRTDVVVVGDTPCEKLGKLAIWSESQVATREEYTAALLADEVGKLIVKAKIQPATGSRYNHDAAAELLSKFGAVIPPDWRYVALTCDKAGASYEYAVYNQNEKVASGSLKNTCTAPRQNFAINIVEPATVVTPRGIEISKTTLLVHQFNNAPTAAVVSAFNELLAPRLPVSKF